MRRSGTADQAVRKRKDLVADEEEEEVVARSEVRGRHLRLPLPHGRRPLRARQGLDFGIMLLLVGAI